MPKLQLLLLALTVVILTALATVLYNTYFIKSLPQSEIDSAVSQARHLYNQWKERGESLSNGPCISDALKPGWVVDVVHFPRQTADDLPENQCPSYRDGRSQHFVELDTEGNLVRVK